MKPIPLHYVWTYNDVDRRFWHENLADWLPRRIFDAHVHLNLPAHRVRPMTGQMRRQYWVNEVAEPMDAATAERCDTIVLPGREVAHLAFGWPTLAFDVDAQNQYVRAECVKRAWPCLSILDPRWPAERVAGEMEVPGVIGLKPYYSMIGYSPETRDEYIESSIFDFLPHHVLEVLDARGAWVTLHVPKADRLGHPANVAEIREIRRRYPRVVLVIAHLGRSYTLPHAEESLPQLADDGGLYFDVSAVLNGQVLRLAIETLGPRRLLYGTDNPVFYMRGRRQWHGRSYVNRTNYPFYFNKEREAPQIEASYTLYMYEALKAIRGACEDLQLSRQDVEAIFFTNARRLVDSVLSGKASWGESDGA